MSHLRDRDGVRGLVLGAIAMCTVACASLAPAKPVAEIASSSPSVEVGSSIALSLRLSMPDTLPVISWSASAGTITPTLVDNEVDFHAPETPGEAIVTATVSGTASQTTTLTASKTTTVTASQTTTLTESLRIVVLPAGALKKTAEVLVEVDCNSLKKVWVDLGHPAENFAPPLKIKGTFSLDVDTGTAVGGGSWPTYNMYDDGTHGDRVAGDGIWTERFVFPKSSSKVYFAFDDANPYRVGFESGLAWRFKLAWRGVDAASAGEASDENNLFFIPDRDQVVSWTAEMAAKSGMYEPEVK